MTTVELLQQSLIGKKLRHTNQWHREVVLTVESIKSNSYTRQITPDTRENDWYGETSTSYWYDVTFNDGSVVKFDINAKWDIVE